MGSWTSESGHPPSDVLDPVAEQEQDVRALRLLERSGWDS
jgi:hypothetical protein